MAESGSSKPSMFVGDAKAKSMSLDRGLIGTDVGQKPKAGRKKGLKFSLSESPAVPAVPPVIQGLQSTFTTKNGESFGLSKEDLTIEKEIGHGAYGVVERCLHQPSNTVMAVKRILLTMDETERRRLMMDLDINRNVRACPEACFFYGAFFQDAHVYICMEIMDASMDNFYKKAFELGICVPEQFLIHIAISVMNGLEFLYSQLKVIHRDVKPSNILIDKDARVKVCDFGVSAVLVNSLALTNIGCKPYMAPERLSCDNSEGFNVKSDIWSLGISLVEIGDGIFPYDQQKWKTPFDQMKQVFERPAPNFTNAEYSDDIRSWMTLLLNKKTEERSCYAEILKHPFIEMQKRLLAGEFTKKSLKSWAKRVTDSF